jgi:hypothetical protein
MIEAQIVALWRGYIRFLRTDKERVGVAERGPRNVLVITAVRRSPGTGRRLMPWQSSASGTRVPGSHANPRTGHASIRDYERIRIDMQTLFNDLAIETPLAA